MELKNREKIKKILKIIVTYIVTITLIYYIGKFFEYILFDDSGTYYLQNEFYNQENIDVLFLGSSHVRQAIDTKIIDEKLTVNSFNLGTSSQNYDASYAFLQEADKLYDLKTVYLDTYYIMGQMEDKKDRTGLSSTYIVGDYLKNESINRWLFLVKASTKDYWINGFSPARREWKNLFDADEINDIVKRKESDQYRFFLVDKNKGYTERVDQNDEGSIISSERYSAIPEKFVTDEIKSDIQNIVDYCKNHNIELVLINIPIPDFRLYEVGNYDYYVSEMTGFCKQNGIEYYDFNLCKREYFSSKDELFYDDHHLNGEGARLFCEMFSDFVESKYSTTQLFYDSYQEKVQNDKFKVLGAYLTTNEQRELEIIDNHKSDVEYRFLLGDENTLVQDFSKEKKLVFDKNINLVTLEYKVESDPEKIDQIEYHIE